VRNLAMRAADAAKTTSDLIESSVRRIYEGSNLVNETSSAFTELAVSSEKIAALVAEINAASTEQAQGIAQINQAVSEMDRAVQQNAANAEESAAAAAELKSQAERMKAGVGELLGILNGRNGADPRGEDSGVDGFPADGGWQPKGAAWERSAGLALTD